ncbi:tetratricopeptide repeat protein [Sphingopyxis sp. BSNA05]|uniref:tetratricopeptide repeat protein n=1 Tax=Sphingopyxis sp. BSNA05 TaxID=1236614 RepID=UPI0020B64070|nr:tetratricopeptide repeat protein [Sphingopyxis sp. BSNA05]
MAWLQGGNRAGENKRGGWTNLEIDYRSSEPDVEIPKNAPMRFRDRNLFEVASFASWKDVSRVNAALYPRNDGIVKGGALDQEIRAIADQTRDKKQRTALALRLVQDKIRYLYNGMGFGNYSPQKPEETWKLRYGDCKAKTYLLLAILRRLDIKAVPMLVHTSQRDIVKERLPSFQAFNHIIVKAEIDGTVYWLDGTGSGTRIDDMVNSPTHRYGLPSVSNGAELEEIPIRRPGRPYQSVIVTYDVSAGTDLPAPFELQATLRDSDAAALKDAIAQLSEEKVKELREKTALDYVLDGLVYETSFTFDEDEETGYLTARGLSYLDWDIKTDRHRHELWSVSDNFKVQKTRDEEELRSLPVNLSYPVYFQYQTNYILPDRYATASLDGLAEDSSQVAGFQFSRSVHKNGNRIVSKEEYHTGRWELPAEEFETERRKLARLNRENVKIILPEDRVLPWREVEDFKLSAQAAIHREAFDRHVANAKNDDDAALINRAYFHQILGEYDKAIADVESALAINSDAENYKWLGDLQLGSNPAAAIAAYSEAVAIKPAYFDALLDLIRLHVRMEDFDKAHAVLERAKDAGLTETSVDSIHIEILQAEGKFDQALQIIDDLVEEEPDNASYLADRCLLRAMEKPISIWRWRIAPI